MNKPSKCKNCQWYGKPYWSIINPCDNCPMEHVETFTHWIDPTIEEKDKEIERLNKECDTYMKIATKRGNIIDELEKYILNHYIAGHTIQNASLDDIINKLKELKEGKR